MIATFRIFEASNTDVTSFVKSKQIMLTHNLFYENMLKSFLRKYFIQSLSVLTDRGKSGLHRAGCRRNSCGSDPKESATEKIPLESSKGEKAR